MARVALVNPQLATSTFDAGLYTADDIMIRHALAHLGGILKGAGHDVGLVDLRLLRGWQAYDDALRAMQADFVCFTAHTCERGPASEAVRRARRVLPRARLIAGGADPTMVPDVYIGAGADFVVKGEGDVSLPGLVAEPRGESVFFGETPTDLDALPFAYREMWPDYRTRTRKRVIGFRAPLPVVDMTTQRGCPWQCRFCWGPGEQNLYTKPRADGSGRLFSYRSRSPEHVCEELAVLQRKYEFNSVIFHDDQFVVRPRWAEAFCQEVARRWPVKPFRFWAALRADVICRHDGSGGLMEALAAAGLHTVSIGFESFSDDLLNWLNKGTTADQNFRAASICSRLGLDVYGNFMFGVPREDGRWHLEDDEATIEAIRAIRPRVASMSFFSPIPGSALHDWCEKQGLVRMADAKTVGQRFTDEAKIDGVDYGLLNSRLNALRRELSLAEQLPLWRRFWRRPARNVLRATGLLRTARRVRDSLTRREGYQDYDDTPPA